jgi:23S rRNA (pseudouridine1915-N3)-methyltransferase
MELSILAIGRMRPGPEAELCAKYLERARQGGKALGFRGFGVKELAESRAPRAAARKEAEAAALFAAMGGVDRMVCLDAGGELLYSEGFARSLARDAEKGIARLTFVIGGPDGLGDAALERADRRLSFGRLTWPHLLCRALLAEQLYRAMTILSGHPYHRA